MADSRAQMELGVSATKATEVRTVSDMLSRAPSKPEPEDPFEGEWILVNPRFREKVVKILGEYETMLQSHEDLKQINQRLREQKADAEQRLDQHLYPHHQMGQ